MASDFRALWEVALPYHQFAQEAASNQELWAGMYRIARIPDWALEAARSAGMKHHFLVLAEDWCGDGANSIPYLAKLADLSRAHEVRVLRRDQHPEVMDRYLTDGARSIPIVIVLDRDFRELGHWGPRPIELQAWVREARRSGAKASLYAQIRRWYAKDKGQSVLREVLSLLRDKPSAVSVQPSAGAVKAG